MSRTSPAGIVPNPYNLLLSQQRGLLSRAERVPLAPVCDPEKQDRGPASYRATFAANITLSRQRRRSLKTIQIKASTAGANIIIPAALAGAKAIYEIVMWNVDAQSLTWLQGSSIVLLDLPDYPALTGLTLGFNGNWEMPHWEIDNGQDLILNLQNATRVTGFIRYSTI